MSPEEFCDEEMLRGYKRNQQLVDLDYVPNEVQAQALEMFKDYKLNGREKIFNYFISKRMKNLMDCIQEF